MRTMKLTLTYNNRNSPTKLAKNVEIVLHDFENGYDNVVDIIFDEHLKTRLTIANQPYYTSPHAKGDNV